MQLLRSNAKSLSLQDREQISEMAKLGPIVHSSLLDIERALNVMFGAESLLISSPVLWKSWQGECGEATEIVRLAKFTPQVNRQI
jgi:hypothetical protein